MKHKSKVDKSFCEPIQLLEQLQKYSEVQLKKLPWEDKEQLLWEIELYLAQGITPLQKFYDRLKEYFAVPSRDLLAYDKNYFYKQMAIVRKCQKQEIK